MNGTPFSDAMDRLEYQRERLKNEEQRLLIIQGWKLEPVMPHGMRMWTKQFADGRIVFVSATMAIELERQLEFEKGLD